MSTHDSEHWVQNCSRCGKEIIGFVGRMPPGWLNIIVPFWDEVIEEYGAKWARVCSVCLSDLANWFDGEPKEGVKA